MTEIKKLPHGLTDETLAVAGYSVFMACAGAPIEWHAEKTDRLTWEMAASNTSHFLMEVMEAKADLNKQNFTMMVHQWMCEGQSFFDLPIADRLVWETLAAFWASCVCEEGALDIPALAKFAVERHQQKLARLLPKEPPSVMNDHAERPHEKPENTQFSRERLAELGWLESPRPARASAPAQGNGMSKSFHRLIDMKIDEYNRKITALFNLKQKINSDCDEALYEIIAPLLQQGE